jgi:hypothetical protein
LKDFIAEEEKRIKKELAKTIFKQGVITEKLVKFSLESATDAVKFVQKAGDSLIAASKIVSHLSYGFAAIAFLAKTALDYNKL